MNRSIAALIVAMCLLAPATATAGISKEDIFHGSAGALLTFGGDLWTEPDRPSNLSLDAVPFGDTAGGAAVGGGVFFQARFIKWIGLELGLLFEHNHQWYNIEYNGGLADLRYHIRYTAIRIPILLQAVFNTPSMRVTLGIGPEFVVTTKDETDVTLESGAVGNLETVKSQYQSRSQSDVFLCAAIGFAFKVWRFSIPFNIRFGYNATQPKGYQERLGIENPLNPLVGYKGQIASQSMDLRLMTGLAYDF